MKTQAKIDFEKHYGQGLSEQEKSKAFALNSLGGYENANTSFAFKWFMYGAISKMAEIIGSSALTIKLDEIKGGGK